MDTAGKALILVALLATLAPRGVAAQESPDTITRAEHQCQDAFGHALASFSEATGACLAECETSPGRRCDVFSPDTITGDCLSRAGATAQIPVLRQCAGTDCPECYGGGLDCPAYADSTFSETAFFVEQAIAALYCDDSSSADGLTRAEQSCQRGLTRASGRFIQTLQRCFANCQQAVQRGATGFSSCESAFLDTPTFDPRTQRCIDRARAGLLDSCNNHCADPPDCFPYSCSEAAQLVEAQALGAEPTVYCQDVPPPVCGDGQITGNEVCDPTASPTGCGPDEFCLGCFVCLPQCGNGIVDPGEVCDPFAIPNGCAAGLVCSRDCTACITPPAGFCVPTSPDTCSAGLHGCFQPCDNNTPGSACVSSVGGAFVCVQEVCTFRTCDISADCNTDEVCFTEGCCGPTAAAARASIDGWR
jgi:hypothetical protein